MKRAFVLALFLTACGPKSPRDAAASADLQVSDGFRARAGVAVSSRYVVSDLDLLRSVDVAQLTDKSGTHFDGAVELRSRDLGIVLIQVGRGGLNGAAIGEATLLKEGDEVVAQIFDAKGVPSIKAGKFVGWHYHLGKAYLGTTLETPDDATATGVFGPDGRLVGVQAFKRGRNLTLVLPIGYLVAGDRAPAVNAVRPRAESKKIAAMRLEAQKHTAALPDPLRFEDLTFQQTFSHTALVGALVMLDKKDTPAHTQPVRYKLEAVDAARNRRTIAEGVIDKKSVQWATSPESTATVVKSMTEAFGQSWVEANIAPYDFGVLRYRIPFAPFCPRVTDREVHALTLILADGRKTSDIGFSDLVNICAGREDGDGTALEQSWGMTDTAKPKGRGKGRR
jgi:hypothetical protein